MDAACGHAFISYVREDADRVGELQELLQAAGVQVWRDTADLLPGEDWRRAIRRAISDDSSSSHASPRTALLVTKASRTRNSCRLSSSFAGVGQIRRG